MVNAEYKAKVAVAKEALLKEGRTPDELARMSGKDILQDRVIELTQEQLAAAKERAREQFVADTLLDDLAKASWKEWSDNPEMPGDWIDVFVQRVKESRQTPDDAARVKAAKDASTLFDARIAKEISGKPKKTKGAGLHRTPLAIPGDPQAAAGSVPRLVNRLYNMDRYSHIKDQPRDRGLRGRLLPTEKSASGKMSIADIHAETVDKATAAYDVEKAAFDSATESNRAAAIEQYKQELVDHVVAESAAQHLDFFSGNTYVGFPGTDATPASFYLRISTGPDGVSRFHLQDTLAYLYAKAKQIRGEALLSDIQKAAAVAEATLLEALGDTRRVQQAKARAPQQLQQAIAEVPEVSGIASRAAAAEKAVDAMVGVQQRADKLGEVVAVSRVDKKVDKKVDPELSGWLDDLREGDPISLITMPSSRPQRATARAGRIVEDAAVKETFGPPDDHQPQQGLGGPGAASPLTVIEGGGQPFRSTTTAYWLRIDEEHKRVDGQFLRPIEEPNKVSVAELNAAFPLSTRKLVPVGANTYPLESALAALSFLYAEFTKSQGKQ